MSPEVKPDRIPALASAGAETYMRYQRHNCATSVLASINDLLGGGLSFTQCLSLTAGLGGGMASGCVCGALSGAELAIGLMLGQGAATKEAAKAMHDRFAADNSSACCRVIRKKGDTPKEKTEICVALTACAAQTACRIILEHRPGLSETVARG